jgi:hypothetical protein
MNGLSCSLLLSQSFTFSSFILRDFELQMDRDPEYVRGEKKRPT